jgi:hypothetical protein
MYVIVNEVSTVAAAYAMAGFATDATHVGSSGTALALTGIANAFANAANLVDLPSGTALATTPAGNGTAPQAEINTLANVLAACVNSNGAVTGGTNPTACYTLFNNAMSSGLSGTLPTDTATAAINIAHNPGAGVAALYGLASGTPAFAGGLTGVPNDWTVGMTFAGSGLSYPGDLVIDASGNVWVSNSYPINIVAKLSSAGGVLTTVSMPTGGMAIDNSGNVWITNGLGTNVSKLSNSGTVLSNYTGGGLTDPGGVAIDGLGNAWIANYEGIIELSNSGVVLSGSNGYAHSNSVQPTSIAVDGSGNAWATTFGGRVVEVASSGSVVSGIPGYSVVYEPSGVSIDASGDAWVADPYTGQNNVGELSNSGAILSGANGYAAGGLNKPAATAIDGAGNVWITSPTGNSISELTHSGVALGGVNGYLTPGLNSPVRIAIDGSGDVWAVNSNGYNLTELLGVATPVITPIAAGLPATPTADGSSNLGTRP